MIQQVVFNTSKYFELNGVKKAVFSPGSRNAPLVVSFARNERVKKWIIPDERAAGFIALGIAQKKGEPVILCCTSGTALLNYAPAVAEAYYREVPMIVLSADRPPDLIDQRDGQTIRQHEALHNHVKASYQLPLVTDDESAVTYEQLLLDAIGEVNQLPKGPVHINVPFKEPFYPTADQQLTFSTALPFSIQETSTKSAEFPFQIAWFRDKKVLLLIGQKTGDATLDQELKKLEGQLPILQSPLNNLGIDGIKHVDLFLDDQPALRPDVLITSGLSVLSKKLKNFIRKNPPEKHFHFDPAHVEVDTYQSNPIFIQGTLLDFLQNNDYLKSANLDFYDAWKKQSLKIERSLKTFSYPGELSETEALYYLINRLPEDSELHLSNSMSVRFAELFGVSNTISTWSNRGTSGIDGCTSTAVGHAIVSDKLNVLITGELAFLYDRNAFFHNYDLKNLRVIVSNNQGGGIFRLIEGPSRLPELEDYFETRHNRTAKYICRENNMDYLTATSAEELENCLTDFFQPGDQARLLEVFTTPETNGKVFKDLKKYMNDQIND